ncbi:cysteine-rich protein 2 isoform X1 [Pan troglodytes]|uniref:cysteine-rich protein 2 isoform X1 n=1 Tax=Pan troglodytes TaxID=9598 RepID=UPI0007DBAC7A|nr:cysteine-rich protein 2 isoform X1 [Pan troglodytes]
METRTGLGAVPAGNLTPLPRRGCCYGNRATKGSGTGAAPGGVGVGFSRSLRPLPAAERSLGAQGRVCWTPRPKSLGLPESRGPGSPHPARRPGDGPARRPRRRHGNSRGAGGAAVARAGPCRRHLRREGPGGARPVPAAPHPPPPAGAPRPRGAPRRPPARGTGYRGPAPAAEPMGARTAGQAGLGAGGGGPEENGRRARADRAHRPWPPNAPSATRPCTSHDGKPFCHKPCYATLFGPKGVNIGGAGSYIYEKPLAEGPQVTGPIEVPAARAEERKASGPPKGPSRASSVTTFTGEPNTCPRCSKKVYFAEKVTSLGKDWHRPCLRCERCGKTLTPGGHAEHDGQPYCHKPCYGILFGPKGVNTGAVGSYIYDRDPEGKVQP